MSTNLHIACVGSRATPPLLLDWMQRAGAVLVRAGHSIVSGNAPGADQSWAFGGNSVDPTKVTLCLPWDGFEPHAIHPMNGVSTLGSPKGDHRHYYAEAAAHHPAWAHMTPGGRRLHARNVMMVERVQLVLGWTDWQTGGTKSTFELARRKGIPVSAVRVGEDVLALVKKMVRG
jgi:hypothetical protein